MDEKMSNSEKLLRIGAHLLSIPVSIGILIWSAFVTATIWTWLMSPIFGWRSLTIWQALALGCMFSCFTWGFVRKGDLETILKKPDDALERTGLTLLRGAFIPAILLGIAWIIKDRVGTQ